MLYRSVPSISAIGMNTARCKIKSPLQIYTQNFPKIWTISNNLCQIRVVRLGDYRCPDTFRFTEKSNCRKIGPIVFLISFLKKATHWPQQVFSSFLSSVSRCETIEMGVQGLWSLVGPAARPVQLESLRNRKMAIDASIWIHQFMRTMRDKEGNALRNGHLLGFFRRLCKLLFYNIKPVFVFDGGAPALKRLTIVSFKHRYSCIAAIDWSPIDLVERASQTTWRHRNEYEKDGRKDFECPSQD